MKTKPKQRCTNCHFLVTRGPRPQPFDGQAPPCEEPLNEDEREAIRIGQSFNAPWLVACHFDVWAPINNPPASETMLRELRDKERDNFCFYWEYRPGMLLPAAKILQQREAHDKDVSIDRKMTIKGLWIAAIALLLNFLVGLAQAIILAIKP